MQLKVGDVVVHYVHGYIVAVSTVTQAASLLPDGYDNESGEGWQCLVSVVELDMPVPLKRIPLQTRKDVAVPSPFNVNGVVKEGYLYPVPQEIEKILTPLLGRPAPEGPGAPEHEGSFFDGESTDRRQITSGRIEQGLLRKLVIRDGPYRQCDFCGRELPVRLMVAAHIKRRSECKIEERADVNVALAACLLGCDSLFEHGYFTVTEDGVIAASGDHGEITEDLQHQLESLDGLRVDCFSNQKNSQYFAWHRKHHSTR